ncbi:PH domain-containing protein [uncultured Ilyobacter sp.]|uniref:PH domain-containing protein n=1 Tax=uncultured Ilyobacter sp. TaxID=544433 RepID=UPI0029C823DB|nr:PH domain-containing protein [uncultured Ilyobacter sp.]
MVGPFDSKDIGTLKVKWAEKIDQFILEGETIENIFELDPDFAIMTNKRLIFLDKKIDIANTTGHELIFIRYDKIDSVAIEKLVGVFKFNKAIIYCNGHKHSVRFAKEDDILSFVKALSTKIN